MLFVRQTNNESAVILFAVEPSNRFCTFIFIAGQVTKTLSLFCAERSPVNRLSKVRNWLRSVVLHRTELKSRNLVALQKL